MDHGGRPYKNYRFEAAGPHPVEPHPDQPIDGAQPWTAGALTIEDRHLMAQSDELEF